MTTDPPRASDLPAGYDEDDPYEGEDLSSYPEWWRENVELFRSHGMRPYRPSRFSDDAVVHTTVERLESELDAEIALRASDADASWAVVVDGEPVAHVDRERTTLAFTRYDIDADAFERVVCDAVE